MTADRKGERDKSSKKGDKARPDSKAADSENGGGESASSSPSGDPADDEPSRYGDRDGSGPRTASTRSGPPEPKSGRYVYAQSGWEEFCSATCQRDDLPPSAAIDTEVSSTGQGVLRVVSESRSSNERSMRSTSYVSRSVVEIAKVEVRYGRFSNTYDPSPPVRSLELPLAVGDAWTSSWEAETSGDYSAEVLGREDLVVGGRTIETFKIDTMTRFRGQFRGTLWSVVWVDPETATTIRTHGKLRIATDYGRLNSNFDTTLIDGPGYE